MIRPIAAFLLLTPALCAQQFVISTYAGGAPLVPDPTAAVNAAVGPPLGVATDSAGNLYFTSSNCVFKIDPNGVLTRLSGTGIAGYSGDGGPALTAMLNGPAALAVDRAANLYIADSLNNRIRRVSPSGVITTVAGNGGYANPFKVEGDGGPATGAALSEPSQLAVDSAGSLYLWALSPNIRKVTPDGIITTLVGNGTYGYSGDGGPATAASISTAWGLAVDSAGNLYFSDDLGDDFGPGSVRVRKVSPDGIITTVAGTGDPGDGSDTGDGGPATSARLSTAGSLAVDSAGNLYIGDYGRVRRVSTDGVITTVAEDGEQVYSSGLASDPAGNLYLADAGNSRVRKISPDGTVTTVAGNGNSLFFSGDGGAAANAQLNTPVGVAAASDGTLYIADTYNHRVRKVSPAGVITTVAGDGTAGSTGDGGPAAAARLAWPAGLALDGSGNLYVADCLNGRVRKISPDGIITTVAGGISSPLGDGGPATSAQLSLPKDVALDGSGNLYIVDTLNNRVRKVSSDGTISTVAGNGQYAFAGDGGPATAAVLNFPSGVAVDSAGNLYIADTNNYRVRRVSSSGIITTVAGNGVSGYSGDGGPAISAQLFAPVGVKVDAAGNLYIGDGSSVRMVSTTGIVTTVAGNPQTGAWGLSFDTTGDLYVADPSNNAVRLLKPVRPPAQ